MTINSFDQAVALYRRVKPLNGGRNTASMNVRPVGPRNRFMDRIARVDENRYLMLDGIIPAAVTYPPETMSFRNAPILWQRDGVHELIRIRNAPEGINPVAREKFLTNLLPADMRLTKRGGDTFIETDGKEFYLPRPKAYFAAADYFDPTCLWFERLIATDSSSPSRGGAWRRAGKPVEMRLTVLDKDLVKQYKQAINEFYDYMCVVLPVLGDVPERAFDRHVANFVPRMWGKHPSPTHHYVDLGNLSHDLTQKVRSVILDTQHLNRVDLAVMFAKALHLYRRVPTSNFSDDNILMDITYKTVLELPETVGQARHVRALYLKTMYKAADLYARRTY